MKFLALNLKAAIRATILGLALGATCAPALAADARPIPRAAIFGNPERAGGQISPDGRYLSFLAPRNGVLNVWVVERGKPLTEARPLTNEKVRPILNYFWAPNSREILYTQDKDGDENFLLYAVNVDKGTERKLTDFQGVRVVLYGASWKRPDELVIGVNDRDKAFHDPYLLDLRTGALKRLLENTEKYSGFIVDEDLALRFGTRTTPDGGWQLLRFDNGKAVLVDTIGFEDSQTTQPGNLTADGKTLYWNESRGRNTAALVAIDLATGTKKVLAEDGRVDIVDGLFDPSSRRLLAYEVNHLKPEWRALDPAVKADIEFLDARLKGKWSVQSQTRNNRLWLVANDPVTAPPRLMLYDRDATSLTELYVGRPALAGAALPAVCPVEIKSRDGLVLVAYLALPPGSDADGDCRPDKPLPMVLNVHGGPWARDDFGYNPETVWLADRGYASLQVNFRGSTGFGKDFVNRADKEWGGRMHDDLIDAVDWAVRQRIADPGRVAIYGGSYGGYAALWGMTNTPERFACGVAIVAPSNLQTLLASFPPYWESFIEQIYRRIGDPRTDAGKALLKERSPLSRVQNISKPLLIGQGANDPRVKQAEADQIVAAMEEKKIPVTYVLYPDEGHGFARPMNRTSFYAVSEAFLAKCLGGRFEPVGSDFKGSSIQVLKGSEYVPGLREALATTTR